MLRVQHRGHPSQLRGQHRVDQPAPVVAVGDVYAVFPEDRGEPERRGRIVARFLDRSDHGDAAVGQRIHKIATTLETDDRRMQSGVRHPNGQVDDALSGSSTQQPRHHDANPHPLAQDLFDASASTRPRAATLSLTRATIDRSHGQNPDTCATNSCGP